MNNNTKILILLISYRYADRLTTCIRNPLRKYLFFLFFAPIHSRAFYLFSFLWFRLFFFSVFRKFLFLSNRVYWNRIAQKNSFTTNHHQNDHPFFFIIFKIIHRFSNIFFCVCSSFVVEFFVGSAAKFDSWLFTWFQMFLHLFDVVAFLFAVTFFFSFWDD